jgi:lipopolysaccharide/colanic/teichoic acid biosynthesis glycosyltransferase
MIAKRVFDLLFSVTGLLFLMPVFLLIAIWIKLDSPGPVFFRQVRVGRFGEPFRIFKFRTMRAEGEAKGKQITVRDDIRITRAGRFLRRHKLDELPQLLNVARGEMSLVGPRPEVPRYVVLYPEGVREKILSVPPGMTDYASIEYMDENALLADADDPETVYIERVMPAKLRNYERYVTERSIGRDLKIILATLKAITR